MRTSAITLFILISLQAFSQENILPNRINKGTFETIAPSVTGDRSALLFASNYSPSGEFTLYYAKNQSGWNEPELIPSSMYLPRLNYRYGHYLSFDGDRIYFTNRKDAGGLGYNIWSAERTETGWGKMEMLSLKINTVKHEGSPSITADGKTMYFIRCDEMTEEKVKGCKIFKSEKINGEWQEASMVDIELPSDVVTCPRIFPDKKTMIFGAVAPGGKGGYDLFWTKLENGKWKKPIPMDFLNTSSNEAMVSPGIFGHRIYMNRPINGISRLVEYYLPEEFRGEDSWIIRANLNRETATGRVPVYVYDAANGTEVFSDYFTKQSGNIILNEGKEYIVLIRPAKVSNKFSVERIDIRDIGRTEEFTFDYDLGPLLPGEQIIVDGMEYLPNAPYLNDRTGMLNKSIMDFIKTNPGKGINIEFVLSDYQEGELKGGDLTEVRYDSVKTRQMVAMPVENEVLTDTVQVTYSIENIGEVESDSLTLRLRPVDSWEVREIYHNDRSDKEAAAMKAWLLSQNTNLSMVTFSSVREPYAEGKPVRFIRIRYLP